MTVCETEVTQVTSKARERFEFIKKTGQLTENHERLASAFEGKWKYTTKWVPEYGAEAVTSEGTSKVIPLYGGRVLQYTDDGILLGDKVQSMGLIGYDWAQMKMFRTQYNSYSTMFAVARGDWRKGSKEMRLNSDHHIDTLTGARDSGGARISITFDNADRPTQYTVRVFEWAPDGSEEYVASETVYTR